MYSIFSGAGKFCLAHGLGQLTRNVKSDAGTLNFRSDVIVAPPWKTMKMLFMRRKMSKKKKKNKWRMINNNFYKKK